MQMSLWPGFVSIISVPSTLYENRLNSSASSSLTEENGGLPARNTPTTPALQPLSCVNVQVGTKKGTASFQTSAQSSEI